MVKTDIRLFAYSKHTELKMRYKFQPPKDGAQPMGWIEGECSVAGWAAGEWSIMANSPEQMEELARLALCVADDMRRVMPPDSAVVRIAE